MAKIHAIACPISAEGARRLSSSLIAMIEDSVDPGSRGPQIRSLGLSLEGLIEDLRSKLTQIGGSDEFPVLSARIDRIHVFRPLPDRMMVTDLNRSIRQPPA